VRPSATDGRPHVVILGCGFGGLAAAKALANRDVRVTVVDRSNHHLFQPLLYQVATAGLSAPAIAAPIRHILRRARNIAVLMDDALSIDAGRRVVHLRHAEALAYDHLIVATGATHSYFGHDEWSRIAPGLKTLGDAFAVRSRVLLAFERAETESRPERRDEWLTFVVIGGGPTGVEMAGTMAELARHTLADEFRTIEPRRARILLLEGSDRLLQAYAPELSEKAMAQLARLGVAVHLAHRVVGIDPEGVDVQLASGERQRIGSRTVVWAAGVAASGLGKALGGEVDRAGRVKVHGDLTVPGRPEVSVVGDLAAVVVDGQPVPGVAPAAKQMGRCAARNILRNLAGRPRSVFRYRDWGSLATIGRNSAVCQLGRLHLWGWPAWLFWLFVHVFFLIGFRNRLMVLTDWAWSYFTFERYARIVYDEQELKRAEEVVEET
jgi:NADH dehydrogenase